MSLTLNPEIMLWCIGMFVFEFVNVAVKTYQNRNINTKSLKAMWPTGYAQTYIWAIGIYAITYNDFNFWILFFMATGGILGCQWATIFHDKQRDRREG